MHYARGAAASAVALFFCACAWGADPQVCAACHGEGGNSVIPANPSLAQHPAQFIATELFLFREGTRKNAQMSPIAEKLSNAEMNDLAKHFSALKAAPPSHKPKPESASAGPALTQKYNCVQCHGPRLMGQQHIPRIAGQQYEYLHTQLRLFKAQKRSDFDGTMSSAASRLSDEELELIADYVAGLAPQ